MYIHEGNKQTQSINRRLMMQASSSTIRKHSSRTKMNSQASDATGKHTHEHNCGEVTRDRDAGLAAALCYNTHKYKLHVAGGVYVSELRKRR